MPANIFNFDFKYFLYSDFIGIDWLKRFHIYSVTNISRAQCYQLELKRILNISGLNLEEVTDWSEELQPSMRKLKQAMDGLLRTGRLTHSVLRLKCENSHRTRSLMALQMRRDTCFSQAVTIIIFYLIHNIIRILI